MQIDIYIESRSSLKTIHTANTPIDYRGALKSEEGRKLINVYLGSDIQLLLCRVNEAIKICNAELNYVVHDLKDSAAREKFIHTYGNISTPFMVIGNTYVRGVPSLKKIIQILLKKD